MINFAKRQIKEIRSDGVEAIERKIKRFIFKLPYLLFYFFAILPVLIIRLIRPCLLVRISILQSQRIGHFSGNTELYLCERDAGINVPNGFYVDIFYMNKMVCNHQLATMWRRQLHIWPRWIMKPIDQVNQLIPGWKPHYIGNNLQMDRDIGNLLDRFPQHLKFTSEEEAKGTYGLGLMGIPTGAPFVCLIARDSAYLESYQRKDWSYHNYRDVNIQNFKLAAETLADKGYFVIRMGSIVRAALNSNNPGVIDYATNGMRNDFMDIYLGAKCTFCVSVGTGWDAIPYAFRIPIVYVSYVDLGRLNTFSTRFISICKHHFLVQQDRELSLSEIFAYGVGFSINSSDYESMGVELRENSPEEIRDAAVEMAQRLSGTWQEHPDDEHLQKRFWEIFRAAAVDEYEGKALHGEIRARFGAEFLRINRDWLQ